MKKIIIPLILILLLSGCGLINPSKLLLPDDLEFIAVINELDTPTKICEYMLYNFKVKSKPFYILSPYDLYLVGEGNCYDFSLFALFVANYHSYETYQIIVSYNYTSSTHAITVYKIDGGYTFSDYWNYYDMILLNFIDVVNAGGNKWKSYIVYDYDMNIILSGTNI